MNSLKDTVGDYDSFLGKIVSEIESAGFDMRDFSQMDHMCYRTESIEKYEDKKTKLTEVASLLGSTMVNGREISTFRLFEPVLHGDWRVDAIELPAPKEGKPYPDGLEHVELVIYDDIPTFLEKYKGKDFDLRAADRGINPEIGLELGNGHSVKFHLLNLPTVIHLEQKLGVESVSDGNKGIN
jgi:predicted metalloenzyme YecM